MTTLGAVLALSALAVQSPAADSLRLLAQHLPESALVAETRARPLAVRDAVAEALARSELDAAAKLSRAYAAAWSDSFLVREVNRFVGWPPDRKAAKLWADSVRRAGITAFSRDGALSAIRIWRRGLRRAEANADTAGVAAVLGNIGAGFVQEGDLDSAEAYLGRARALASSVGDIRVEANAIGSLAAASEERGNLAEARERYTRALELRARIGDTRGQAADYNGLGLLGQALGDLEEARRQFEAALDLNRREGRTEIAATNLVNLAGLASLDGDFGRAEPFYRDALATWKARERWADVADALYGLGQLEIRRGDYPTARTVLREALAIYTRTGPLAEALAVRRELADALAAQGDLQGALDVLRRAQRIADSARTEPGTRAGISLARADLAVQLNALAEADGLYARADALYRLAREPEGLAEAQEGRGLLLLERDDYAGAAAQLDAALRTQIGAGNQRGAALTRLSLGRLARERGDTAGARQQLLRAMADLEHVGDPVAAAAVLGERAALAAGRGLVAAAESLYRAALGQVEGRAAPEVTWRLHTGLALALRAQGATDEAVRELRVAAAVLEGPARSLAVPERRSGFLEDKWEVYTQLALIEGGRGRVGAVFEASERLRAREMLELLDRGRVAAPSDTGAELVQREQDLRRRIAELTRGLEAGAAGAEGIRGPDVSAMEGTTREALLQAQQAYAELLLEIRERAPRHDALLSSGTATWTDVAKRLAPDAAFIEYVVSDSGSLALVVLPDTAVALDLGLKRRDLARLVEFVRGTLQPRRSASTDSLWRGPLRRLHGSLIAPIEETGLLRGKTRLVVVPHADLHYLPFAALLGGGGSAERFLVERYELMMTPSASVWLALGERRSAVAASGGLALAPLPDRLPASLREVTAIPRLGGSDVRVLTGVAATEEAFRREAPSRRVLHLATYGVLNKPNPLFSFVELRPGGEYDGRLEVHEVFGLRLAADLVVLSACQTGLGSGALADVPAGDDWVGLARAFLHAGAAHVVATLWPVEDKATAQLMGRFYDGFVAGDDPARALARAQRALLATPAAAHPFYWAGFVEVGSAGGVAAERERENDEQAQTRRPSHGAYGSRRPW